MLYLYQEDFLKRMQSRSIPVLVEGKNDRAVLEMAGIKNIFEISGKSPEEVVDVVQKNHNEITILTDYDKEGMRQYKRLKSLFVANGVKVDDRTRRDFKRTSLLSKIEEMVSYFR